MTGLVIIFNPLLCLEPPTNNSPFIKPLQVAINLLANISYNRSWIYICRACASLERHGQLLYNSGFKHRDSCTI